MPIGVIGDDESESAEQLTFVFDAAFLGDDKIAIRNGNDPEIRVFDALGKFVRMIGRRGDGPGEFDEDIHFAGSDSVLVVWDGGHFRTTWFSPDGQMLRDTLVRPSNRTQRGSVNAVRVDGSRLEQLSRTASKEGLRRDTAKVFLLSAEGVVEATAAYPSEMAFWAITPTSQFGATSPFEVPASVVLDGNPYPVATQDHGTWGVRQYDSAGRFVRLIRANIPRMLLPKSQRTQAPFPSQDSLDAIMSLLLDSQGNYWVGRAKQIPEELRHVPWESEVFDVIAGNSGRWLGTVRIPPGMGRVLVIGDRRIAMTTDRGESDVPMLRIYRILKPSPADQ